jgi:hypothetical protein
MYLFKFTDALQARLDYLAERKKSDILGAEEEAELTGLLELDRILLCSMPELLPNHERQ